MSRYSPYVVSLCLGLVLVTLLVHTEGSRDNHFGQGGTPHMKQDFSPSLEEFHPIYLMDEDLQPLNLIHHLRHYTSRISRRGKDDIIPDREPILNNFRPQSSQWRYPAIHPFGSQKELEFESRRDPLGTFHDKGAYSHSMLQLHEMQKMAKEGKRSPVILPASVPLRSRIKDRVYTQWNRMVKVDIDAHLHVGLVSLDQDSSVAQVRCLEDNIINVVLQPIVTSSGEIETFTEHRRAPASHPVISEHLKSSTLSKWIPGTRLIIDKGWNCTRFSRSSPKRQEESMAAMVVRRKVLQPLSRAQMQMSTLSNEELGTSSGLVFPVVQFEVMSMSTMEATLLEGDISMENVPLKNLTESDIRRFSSTRRGAPRSVIYSRNVAPFRVMWLGVIWDQASSAVVSAVNSVTRIDESVGVSKDLINLNYDFFSDSAIEETVWISETPDGYIACKECYAWIGMGIKFRLRATLYGIEKFYIKAGGGATFNFELMVSAGWNAEMRGTWNSMHTPIFSYPVGTVTVNVGAYLSIYAKTKFIGTFHGNTSAHYNEQIWQGVEYNRDTGELDPVDEHITSNGIQSRPPAVTTSPGLGADIEVSVSPVIRVGISSFVSADFFASPTLYSRLIVGQSDKITINSSCDSLSVHHETSFALNGKVTVNSITVLGHSFSLDVLPKSIEFVLVPKRYLGSGCQPLRASVGDATRVIRHIWDATNFDTLVSLYPLLYANEITVKERREVLGPVDDITLNLMKFYFDSCQYENVTLKIFVKNRANDEQRLVTEDVVPCSSSPSMWIKFSDTIHDFHIGRDIMVIYVRDGDGDDPLLSRWEFDPVLDCEFSDHGRPFPRVIKEFQSNTDTGFSAELEFELVSMPYHTIDSGNTPDHDFTLGLKECAFFDTTRITNMFDSDRYNIKRATPQFMVGLDLHGGEVEISSIGIGEQVPKCKGDSTVMAPGHNAVNIPLDPFKYVEGYKVRLSICATSGNPRFSFWSFMESVNASSLLFDTDVTHLNTNHLESKALLKLNFHIGDITHVDRMFFGTSVDRGLINSYMSLQRIDDVPGSNITEEGTASIISDRRDVWNMVCIRIPKEKKVRASNWQTEVFIYGADDHRSDFKLVFVTATDLQLDSIGETAVPTGVMGDAFGYYDMNSVHVDELESISFHAYDDFNESLPIYICAQGIVDGYMGSGNLLRITDTPFDSTKSDERYLSVQSRNARFISSRAYYKILSGISTTPRSMPSLSAQYIVAGRFLTEFDEVLFRIRLHKKEDPSMICTKDVGSCQASLHARIVLFSHESEGRLESEEVIVKSATITASTFELKCTKEELLNATGDTSLSDKDLVLIVVPQDKDEELMFSVLMHTILVMPSQRNGTMEIQTPSYSDAGLTYLKFPSKAFVETPLVLVEFTPKRHTTELWAASSEGGHFPSMGNYEQSSRVSASFDTIGSIVMGLEGEEENGDGATHHIMALSKSSSSRVTTGWGEMEAPSIHLSFSAVSESCNITLALENATEIDIPEVVEHGCHLFLLITLQGESLQYPFHTWDVPEMTNFTADILRHITVLDSDELRESNWERLVMDPIFAHIEEEESSADVVLVGSYSYVVYIPNSLLQQYGDQMIGKSETLTIKDIETVSRKYMSPSDGRLTVAQTVILRGERGDPTDPETPEPEERSNSTTTSDATQSGDHGMFLTVAILVLALVAL